jgi:glycosyltransferase involved in cell wall biosynthesis
MDRLVWARSHHTGPRALFLDDRVPHRWLGAGFPRAHALMDTLIREGYFVTFYPLTLANEDWTTVYADIPREVEVMNEAGFATLETFLKSRQGYYDVIIVSRPHNMALVQPILRAHPDWFKKTRVIYDAEALFSFREAGRRVLRGAPMSQSELEDALRSEVDLAANADVVAAVSEADRAALVQRGVKAVVVVGHALELGMLAEPFGAREGMLFVGAVHEEDSPNGDSLIWFLSDVFPRIAKSLGGDVPFAIVGPNTSRRVRELAVPPVRLMGGVRDLSAIYGAARVFVAPTRYAAGLPHKIHEAAARGLPVVGTSLLAAQLGWGAREMAIADTAEDFAARIVELYSDAARWTLLREAAFERVSRDCSREKFVEGVRELLGSERPVAERRLSAV